MTPVLFFLLMAILEMGLYFRSYLGTAAAVTDGARTASIAGNDLGADYVILKAVRKATATMTTKDIVNLVVFDPASAAACSGTCTATNPVNATVPSVCATSTARMFDTTAKCNVYTPGTSPTGDWYTTDATKYGCTAPNNYSAGYCPTTRKTAKTGVNGPPGFVGVTVTVNHTYISGIFGKTKKIQNTVIASLEPESLQ